jgi:hypothetical protein
MLEREGNVMKKTIRVRKISLESYNLLHELGYTIIFITNEKESV